MRMESYEHGVPSWVDIGVPDPQLAADFYGALFGWESPPGPEEAGGYRIAMVGDAPVAGIGPQQNPGPPAWATYVNVDDADAIAALVTANGGQVLVPPMDVMDVGRMAVFLDPVGAVFSVWHAGVHAGAGIVNEPGTYSWSELITTDVEASTEFYRAVFGWGVRVNGEGADAYTEWTVNGRSVGGMMQRSAPMPAEAAPVWRVYFAVEDTDLAVERIQELGGALVAGPMDVEPGRFAVVSDPAGGVFCVIRLTEALTA
jgi:predicted enzyme related to lactoylglutathione lyase